MAFFETKAFSANRWTRIFVWAHIFGVITALAIVGLALGMHFTEKVNVGDFDLNITDGIVIDYYISGIFLLITVTTGTLALKRPDKSAFWVGYFVLLYLFSVLVLFGSFSGLTRARAHSLARHELKDAMSFYAVGENASKWDNLHKKYECCGAEGYKDWQDVSYGRTSLKVPPSCCLPERRVKASCGLNVLPHDDHAKDKIYVQGCHEPALADLRKWMYSAGFLGIIVSLAHIALAILSCYLVINKKL